MSTSQQFPIGKPDSVRMPELPPRELSKPFLPSLFKLTRRGIMRDTSTPVAIHFGPHYRRNSRVGADL